MREVQRTTMAAPRKQVKKELFYAIERGDTNEVSMILKRFPDLVNMQAMNEMTPIMFAVSLGHLQLVKLLTNQGANIHERHTKSPLGYIKIGSQNDYAIAQHLLEKRADPNVHRLLADVVKQNHGELINLLLVHGAIYICNYEYIDKVTKQPISKKVRYNDPYELQSNAGLNLVPKLA